MVALVSVFLVPLAVSQGKSRGSVVRAPFVFATMSQGREINAAVSPDLPVRIVAIRNLHVGKDLRVEHWFRDLEIEVRNISPKPIYFIDLHVRFPDVDMDRGKLRFPLRYGRIELAKFDAPLTPDDVPIMPGGTHVFKVPASMSVRGFEVLMSERKIPESATKKIELIFQLINFGDGTGYDSGIPVPRNGKISDRIFVFSTYGQHKVLDQDALEPCARSTPAMTTIIAQPDAQARFISRAQQRVPTQCHDIVPDSYTCEGYPCPIDGANSCELSLVG